MRRRLASFIAVLALSTVATAQVPISNADANRDGIVDSKDQAIVQANLGKRCGQAGFDPRADVNRDCVVNVTDVAFVSRYLGTKFPPTISAAAAPAANANGGNNTDVTVSFVC